MKTVLIARPLHDLLSRERSLFSRSDLQVFSASTSDEALDLHRAHRADLIITRLDLPGMPCEQFCARVREDKDHGMVPLILACENAPSAIRASGRCGADVVLLEPLLPLLLIAKARQFLFIPGRESIRIALTAAVNARTQEGAFTCRTRNVSVSGMLIETDRRLAEGALLSCRFYLPVAQLVEAQGRIVRIIERTPGHAVYEYGLLFTEIPPAMRQLLADHVAELSRTEQAGDRPPS